MSAINFNGQNGVATSANVNVVVRDNRNNGGNFKWQVNAVKRIKAWFDIYDLDMSGVNVEIIVNASEIAVKAEHNGVKYLIDTPITAKTSMTKVDSIVADSFRSIVSVVCMEAIKNEIAENEQDEDDAAIEYLREVMPLIPMDIISEKIDECVEDLCLVEDGKTMDFDKFCDVLWDDYVWDEVFTDEALENDTREWMEFNDRVRYIIENEKENIFINYHGEIECEIAPNNDTPCLDYDIDRGIERVADTIEKYLGSYIPSYLDQFGDCCITIYWDEFSDDDMKMLIENDIFAMSVRDTLYERGVIVNLSGFLVYDDGVYVTVDYDKMFNKVA